MTVSTALAPATLQSDLVAVKALPPKQLGGAALFGVTAGIAAKTLGVGALLAAGIGGAATGAAIWTLTKYAQAAAAGQPQSGAAKFLASLGL